MSCCCWLQEARLVVVVALGPVECYGCSGMVALPPQGGVWCAAAFAFGSKSFPANQAKRDERLHRPESKCALPKRVCREQAIAVGKVAQARRFRLACVRTLCSSVRFACSFLSTRQATNSLRRQALRLSSASLATSQRRRAAKFSWRQQQQHHQAIVGN